MRDRARAILAGAPSPLLITHAALVLRVARRPRGGFAKDLLTLTLREGPAALTEALLDSADRDTARLAYRTAVERRLLPVARLARTAAHHHDVAVQDMCADATVAALGDGECDAFSDVVGPLLASRQPRIRAAGVTALRRIGRHADAEPFLADRSALVRACARWVSAKAGADPARVYRALCADPAARPAAVVGLGECGVREDADLVRSLLVHPVAGVRACAVAGLRALEEVRVEDVQPLLDDASAAVVRGATAALLPSADRLPRELLRGLLAEGRPRHQRVAGIRLLRAAGVRVA